jgi:hypothetical protein
MPTLKRRPKFAPDQMVRCIESYGTSLDDASGGCRAGTRLFGSHPKVVQRPQFFIDADAPDDQIEAARKALYPEGQAIRA